MTVPQAPLQIFQGSLFTVTIPAPTGATSGWGVRMQLRSAPVDENGIISVTLTTGGGGIVWNGAAWVATITPTQSNAMSLLAGVWDAYGDPDGVPDNATVILEFGTWSMRPAVTAATLAPFTTASLGGLGLWVRGDMGVTLNFSRISKWADQSGAGNDLTGLDPNQPTYTTLDSALGGSAVLFSGNQKLTTRNISISQPCTRLWVGRLSVLTGNPGLFDDATTRQIAYVSNAGTTWSMDAGGTLTGGTPDTGVHAMAFVFNGTTSALYIDTAAAPVLSGTAGNNLGSGGDILGTQSTGYMTGAVYEYAIVNRVLSNADLTKWFAYALGVRRTTTPPSTFAADGNSIMVGFEAFPINDGFAGLVANKFPAALYVNDAFSGYTTPQVDAQAAVGTDPHASPLRPRNVVMMLEVVNDYNSGSTAAQCITHLTTYVTNRHAAGWKVAMCTVLPAYVFSNAPTGEADRQTINAAIRSGATGADAIIDLAAQPLMGNAANINNLTYYVDQLHPTSYGHTLLEPIATAVISTMLA